MKQSRKLFVLLLLLVLMLGSGALAQEVSVDFVEAELFSVLEILTRQAGLNLIAGEDVRKNFNKNITIHLKEITYQEALLNIIRAQGLDYEIDAQNIVVSAPPVGVSTAKFKTNVKALYLFHLEADKVAALLKELYPKIVCKPGLVSNELIIEGRPSEINRILGFIEQIDLPIPQVLIESKVIEISGSELETLGLRFGSTSGSLSYVLEQGSDKFERGEDFTLGLAALASRGQADILATPKIVTLDGNPAEINIGSKVPYAVPAQSGSSSVYWRVEYIDAGVKLKITPKVLDGGQLLVDIEPEVSTVSEWRSTAAGEFPVISTRNVKTQVRVKDGETIVIGGLLSNTDRETVSKVPLLGDIPLLGWFFQTRRLQAEKSEIIFMITPRLLIGDDYEEKD